MSSPRITIIIPTRERSEVLLHTLRTVTTQDHDALEILVSDNASTDRTREVVASFDDPRIRYVCTDRRLSMSHNWEFALSHVSGGWVGILGDDDGLLPGALSAWAELVRSTGVSAIRTAVCGYAWPAAAGERYGNLDIPLGHRVEIRSCHEWLTRVLAGQAAYTDLPMLYNGGFVAHEVLERIRVRTGSIYRSSIPDVYTAVAIASVVDRFAFSHRPLAINGASRHSTGTAYFSAPAHSGSSADLFHSEGIIPLHADYDVTGSGRFPRSLQAMVYESHAQSAALRTGTAAVPLDRQLATILATNLENRADVEAWAQSFANRHGLDLGHARQHAARLRRRLRWRHAARRFADETLQLRLQGDAQLPLQDVQAAALATAAVLRARRETPTWRSVLARRIRLRLSGPAAPAGRKEAS